MPPPIPNFLRWLPWIVTREENRHLFPSMCTHDSALSTDRDESEGKIHTILQEKNTPAGIRTRDGKIKNRNFNFVQSRPIRENVLAKRHVP